MNRETTQVQLFGRTSYEKPLTFIQEMSIKGSIKEEILAEVGEADWIELIAFPVADLLHVIGQGSEEEEEEEEEEEQESND